MGIYKQAINTVLAELEQVTKERNTYRKQVNDAFTNGYIHKDKVKEVINKIDKEEKVIQKMFDEIWNIDSKTNTERAKLSEYATLQQEVSAIKGMLEEVLKESEA